MDILQCIRFVNIICHSLLHLSTKEKGTVHSRRHLLDHVVVKKNKKILVRLLFCRLYYQSLIAIILHEVPYYHNNTLKIGNLPIYRIIESHEMQF
jgi:hypothetical protein